MADQTENKDNEIAEDPNNEDDENKALMSKTEKSEFDKDSFDYENDADRFKGDKCCLCIPIVGGVITMGILSILLIMAYLVITILLFWNYNNTDWWFPLVSLLIIFVIGIPAMFLIFMYLCDKNRTNCKRLRTAMILMGVLHLVLFTWCMAYLLKF